MFKSIKILVISLLFVAATMSIVGVLRGGESIDNFEVVASILAAEPVFIYASVLSYLDATEVNLLAFPWDIITGLVGAVPTVVFPDKADFFVAYSSRTEEAYSGFGGVHHMVSLISNFGVIGFPVVALMEGFFLGFLISRINVNPFYRAASFSSIGIAMFILYREGLQVPVKLYFFNFFIFPFLILTFLRYLGRIKDNVRAAVPV